VSVVRSADNGAAYRRSSGISSLSMVTKIRIGFVAAGVVALVALVSQASSGGLWWSMRLGSSEAVADASAGAYPAVGVRAGVHNDGQSALWDLNITDHFHYFGPPQRARGYKPDQPINFSHVIHVQQNKMECQYCHWSVSKAAYAAIPEEETCMGCHGALVAGKSEQGKKDIEKLKDYYKRGEPIPWVKVHVMPDYLKFNHKRHVKAGVACQECHGQVPEMEKVERVSSMKMGWCIDCHRQKGASIDCLACHGHK
jgi:hypothetical protein